MADSDKPKAGPPESPTTARELDFDDDDVPSSPKLSKPSSNVNSPAPKTGGETQTPQQPPRPMSPREQNELTLREAFPSIEAGVVKAVLAASGGNVEPAFNALLGMTDPDSVKEQDPPAQPPRPVAESRSPQPRSQLEQDEIYARQLAEHYQNQEARRQGPRRQQPQQQGYRGENRYGDEPERSFIDDDLPEIGENIRKGFLETQTKVNSFFANLKKKIDGEDEETPPPQPPRRPGQQQYGRRSGDFARRSSDRDRYDADPQVLGDDFTALQMNDNELPPRKSSRPTANPDLFKPTPRAPSEGRRVSFQDGPPEEIGDDLYRRSPDPTKRPSSTASNKNSKWQPLSTVDPSPVADHDPFSLGDSDEEDAKKKDDKKDLKPDDSERLKKATAEAMSEELGSGNSDKNKKGEKELGAADIDGTKDKKAEDLAQGGK